MNSGLFQHPHRRRNILTGEWVSVSPHRATRPWQGKVESAAPPSRTRHDPHCYLCSGNARANGARNPAYVGTFAFDNDFAAFRPTGNTAAPEACELLEATAHAGQCRVLCFSERHDLTLAELSVAEIRAVVDRWIDETGALGQKWRWVQVFENKGEVMGCSNPHPHGQIWATDFIPNEPAKEAKRQLEYFKTHGQPLLMEYLRIEMRSGERIVVANEDWVAVVPWWAVWPFETLLLPRHPCTRIVQLEVARRDSLAALLHQLLRGYDTLFCCPFPYSMGWHGAPFDGNDHPEWTLHAHFYPPLLRSSTVRKFMVGYEMMAEPQRDVTAEQAAQQLRDVCTKSVPVMPPGIGTGAAL